MRHHRDLVVLGRTLRGSWVVTCTTAGAAGDCAATFMEAPANASAIAETR